MFKKIAIAGTTGGITGFVCGWVLYCLVLFERVQDAMLPPLSAQIPPDVWVYPVGYMTLGWAMAYILLRIGKPTSFFSGMRITLAILLPVVVVDNLFLYAGMNLALNLPLLLSDIAVKTFAGSLAGGVIGFMVKQLEEIYPPAGRKVVQPEKRKHEYTIPSASPVIVGAEL